MRATLDGRACRGEVPPVRCVALALALLGSEAGAERRKNALPADLPLAELGSHERRFMVALGQTIGASAGTEHGLRFFVHDRVTVGVRASGRGALDAELGVSLLRVEEPTRASHERVDVVGTLGIGAGRWRPLAGLAVRMHPRTRSLTVNAMTFELGARATVDGVSAVIAVGVMWPAVKRRRTCLGGYWD